MQRKRRRETRKQRKARELLGSAMGDSLILGVLRQNNATSTEKVAIFSLLPQVLEMVRTRSKSKLQAWSDKTLNDLMWTGALGIVPPPVPAKKSHKSRSASPEAKNETAR